MACIESCVRKIRFKPLSQSICFLFCFTSVEQVKTTNNGMYRPRTSCQHILQTTMSTARKQESHVSPIKSSRSSGMFGQAVVMLCCCSRFEKNLPFMASGETITLACEGRFNVFRSILGRLHGKNFHKRVDRGHYDRLKRHKYLKMHPFKKIFFRIGT